MIYRNEVLFFKRQGLGMRIAQGVSPGKMTIKERFIRQVRTFISSMSGCSSTGWAGIINPLIPSPPGRGLG